MALVSDPPPRMHAPVFKEPEQYRFQLQNDRTYGKYQVNIAYISLQKRYNIFHANQLHCDFTVSLNNNIINIMN